MSIHQQYMLQKAVHKSCNIIKYILHEWLDNSGDSSNSKRSTSSSNISIPRSNTKPAATQKAAADGPMKKQGTRGKLRNR